MFNLCSIPLCFHQATHHCIACNKSLCAAHLYEAAVQSSHQSSHVILCERCLQERRPFNLNTARLIRPENHN